GPRRAPIRSAASTVSFPIFSPFRNPPPRRSAPPRKTIVTSPLCLPPSTDASSSSPKPSQEGWAARNLDPRQAARVAGEWFFTARPDQYPLDIDRDTWLVIGGRGSGKTRLGAEWVNGLVRGLSPFSLHRYGIIALIGETLGDVREVMIDGPSGIMGISRHARPRYEVV